MHKDIMGTDIQITPEAVNWMTAGKGVVHSERTPDDQRDKEKNMHGFQIWVGLPKDLEQKDPEFQHLDAEDIPSWENDGVKFRVIAGEAFEKKSPVKVYSPLYFIEICTQKQINLDIGEKLFGEVGMYVLDGSVTIEGQNLGPKQ